MKTLNAKLEQSVKGTKGLVKQSLIELRKKGKARTAKNQGRQIKVWTKNVCEILKQNNIPFSVLNDAPRGGKCGEHIVLTSKSQLTQIYQEIETAKKEYEEKKASDAKILQERKENSLAYIMIFLIENKDFVSESLAELNELKIQGNKEVWHVKANALVQRVCNNDFVLGFKEIYAIIKASNI